MSRIRAALTEDSSKPNALSLFAKEMYERYAAVFKSLSEDQRTWINAVCDCECYFRDAIHEVELTTNEAADILCFALENGDLPANFSDQELIAFCSKEGVPMRPDWKWRLEAVSQTTAKAGGNEGGENATWVRRLKTPGAKWKDISITIAPGGTLIKLLEGGAPIIETWTNDPGFLNRREGKLLELFQESKTLPGQEKRIVAILRKKLQQVSGISEDPIISEGDGTYTRRFEMNITRGDWGGVSEYSGGAAGAEEEEDLRDHAELYKNDSTIKRGRRR